MNCERELTHSIISLCIIKNKLSGYIEVECFPFAPIISSPLKEQHVSLIFNRAICSRNLFIKTKH